MSYEVPVHNVSGYLRTYLQKLIICEGKLSDSSSSMRIINYIKPDEINIISLHRVMSKIPLMKQSILEM